MDVETTWTISSSMVSDINKATRCKAKAKDLSGKASICKNNAKAQASWAKAKANNLQGSA